MPEQTATSVPDQSSGGGIDLSELRVRTLQQAKSELPDPAKHAFLAEEPTLTDPNSLTGKAKKFAASVDSALSEKVFKPFRQGLNNMGSDLQDASLSGHTKTGGQLTGPARALAGAAGTALKWVPVGENLRDTAAMSVVPPELGPEGKALSKEVQSGQRVSADLTGLRLRTAENPKSPFRIASETPDKVSDFHSAVQNTEGAELHDKGLTLDVVRHQKPEQAGERAIRTGVFFLPEKKSPYQRYYTTGKQGYGGTQRIEGRTTFENPIIAKGASGGKVPERAYDAINGQGAYDEMRQDVLDATTHGWNRKTNDELTQNVANVLEQYGGNPDLAEDIVHNSKGGNTLPYAVQEHIVASSARKAGHDGIIGFSKIKGQPRLSEVFDLRHDKYPISSELFESKSPAIYTSEGAQPLADKLGARVVGSVAKKGESARDLDLRIDGDYNESDVIAKMKQSGYGSRGSSLVSPQEAKSSGKSYGSLGWKRAEHFENEDGHKIDVWHDEPDKDAPNLQGLRVRNVKPQAEE